MLQFGDVCKECNVDVFLNVDDGNLCQALRICTVSAFSNLAHFYGHTIFNNNNNSKKQKNKKNKGELEKKITFSCFEYESSEHLLFLPCSYIYESTVFVSMVGSTHIVNSLLSYTVKVCFADQMYVYIFVFFFFS